MRDDEDIVGDAEHFISELHIDPESLPVTSIEMQHERRVAIFDLVEENAFRVIDCEKGPYVVTLSLKDGQRLIFDVIRSNGYEVGNFQISLVPFRRIIKDYFMICESYHNAIRTATTAKIEAIDMGRRGLHNEGSRMLSDGLRNQAEMGFKTSRHFFTLICSLHRQAGK